MDVEMAKDYLKNSLRVDSPEMTQICKSAAQHGVVVVLGFSERDGDSLYISQAVIDGQQQGRILSLRRKIKPTHMERTIFGDASGETLNGIVDTSAGRVGALSCWEHIQPLLKYHMYSQREQIHVAAWPPLHAHRGHELWSLSKDGEFELPILLTNIGLGFPSVLALHTVYYLSRMPILLTSSCLGGRTLSRTYAMEAQAFVIHATSVLTDKGISQMRTADGVLFAMPGGGSSAIYGPDGVQLTEDLDETEEGILYADIDLEDILRAKSFVDLCGHYSRPDLLWLGVDSEVKLHVRPKLGINQ